MAPIFETIIVSLLTAMTPSPKTSIAIASKATGADYYELRSIVKRESWFQTVGVHARDAWTSGRMYQSAVRVGWLDPQHCEAHRGHQEGWGPRGIAGLSASFNLRWLAVYGLSCAPPWVLDVPLVSAFAAATKHNAKCWRRVKVGPRKYIREIDPRGANGWCR